jgi:AcrR family transcriptional regulator
MAGSARSSAEGRESANAQRILRVAERLFSRRGYRNVTVRDIADAAHVTHPLIYHYFGSKRGLFSAVLEKNQGRMRAIAERSEGAEETILNLIHASLSESRTYQLILTRAFAGGMRTADWPGGFPGIEAATAELVAGLPAGHDPSDETQARELLVAAVAMLHGWILLEDHLLEMAGLTSDRRDEVREIVVRSMMDVLRPALPPAGG